MRKCKDCNEPIEHRGNRAVRCEECQRKFRKIIRHSNKSARMNSYFYQFWKFLKDSNFSPQELEVLFHKRMSELKQRLSYTELRRIKTEMVILREMHRLSIINNRRDKDA